MIRRIGLLVIAGALLSACGTVSAVSAMRTWVDQSNFHTSMKTLTIDVRHSASALRDVTTSSASLHTVCAVLLVDTESANASLPTPDNQSTNLLSKAYTNLGAGANQCYKAGADPALRAAAIASLAKGLSVLAEATVRVDVVSLTH
ncbi:MAG: hypothetical protein ACYC1I_01175 [Acidimicrobiales bacterium]